MKYIVTLNGKNYEIEVVEGKAVVNGVSDAPAAPAQPAAPAPAAAPVQPAKPAPAAVSGEGEPVKSPMPGTILDVRVKAGDQVKAGQIMFILEAMKMENEITAPRDGVITAVSAAKGAAVETGAVIALIK
jgi:biotin carboxyl carrier protein